MLLNQWLAPTMLRATSPRSDQVHWSVCQHEAPLGLDSLHTVVTCFVLFVSVVIGTTFGV